MSARFSRSLNRGHWQVFLTALCSTRRRRGRHRWDALRPDKHRAVMARRGGQGMKPLAARACARPLTAPSTMALRKQPNHARCAIQLPDPPFSTERARSRSSAGYRPATLPLDSLVGSLAACPIPSLSWRKTDSNFWSLNHNPVRPVLTPAAMAGHIRHVCFRRAPRINPARDAIAPGQPHPQRKGRSAPGLTP